MFKNHDSAVSMPLRSLLESAVAMTPWSHRCEKCRNVAYLNREKVSMTQRSYWDMQISPRNRMVKFVQRCVDSVVLSREHGI